MGTGRSGKSTLTSELACYLAGIRNNKEGKGKKESLVAMIRDSKSEDMVWPRNKRLQVKEIILIYL